MLAQVASCAVVGLEGALVQVVEFEPRYDPDSWNFGDEPRDHEAVTFGINLWKKYRENLTFGQFLTELGNYMSKFARYPPLRDPVDSKTEAAYPYPVGYFNNIGRIYNILKEQRR